MHIYRVNCRLFFYVKTKNNVETQLVYILFVDLMDKYY